MRPARVLAGVLLGAVTVVAGQTPPQSQPTFRSGVEIVRLDASVLDRNRQPIKGLKASDFTVLEDGKPMKVVALSEVDIPDPPPVTAPWIRDVTPDVATNQLGERRLFVMVIDDANTQFDMFAMNSVTKIANELVDRLGPQDLMAVVFTADNRHPQDFTNDRTKLRQAIGRFKRLGEISSPLVAPMIINTLFEASSMLIDIPERRKALLYIGSGLLADWNGMGARLQDAFRLAQRANVNIYSFDVCGLRAESENVKTCQPGGGMEFIQTIAENTGGRATVNTNDFTEGIVQAYRENSWYIVVGYESTSMKGIGHYRRVEIRVNRPGAEVRARTLHYADPPQKPKRNAAPPSPALKAIAGLLPNPDLPLRATIAPFGIAGRRDQAALAIVLGVEQRPMDATLSTTHRVCRSARERVRSGGSSARSTTPHGEARAAPGDGRHARSLRSARAHGSEAGVVSTAARRQSTAAEYVRQRVRRRRGAGFRESATRALRDCDRDGAGRRVGAKRRARVAAADRPDLAAHVRSIGSRDGVRAGLSRRRPEASARTRDAVHPHHRCARSDRDRRDDPGAGRALRQGSRRRRPLRLAASAVVARRLSADARSARG